jgi:hypothetical protein
MSWQEHSWARKFPQALLNPIFLPRNLPAKKQRGLGVSWLVTVK